MDAIGALEELPGATLAEGLPLRHTGWQSHNETLLLPEDPTFTGPLTLRFGVADAWDRAYDSVLLIDDVQVQ